MINRIKKIVAVISIIAMLGSLFTGCGNSENSSIQKDDIIILYTNDIHCNGENNMGYAGLAAYKKECEAITPYVSLVDCGDAMKEEMFGLVPQSKYIVTFLNAIMNKVGYDYAAFGNHEFDYGMNKVEQLLEGSNAQYLACNLFYSGDGESKISEVKPYAIETYGETKVGFVGVITPNTVTKSRKAFFEEDGEKVYHFTESDKEFFSCVQSNIDACKNEGADYIVLLSHLGDTENYAPYLSTTLVENTSGIDIVIDAHSHSVIPSQTIMDSEGNEVLLTSGGSDFANIGQVVISSEGGISTELISEYEKKDQEVVDLMDQLKAYYESDWKMLNAFLQEELTESASYVEVPENIIVMIGDGMGHNIVEATEKIYKEKLEDGTLELNKLPVQGTSITYSSTNSVTDSAAGGTALSTGYKTSNKTIAMDENDETSYTTLLEIAHEKGKSTGIVATKNVTDATPASFTAHVAERTMQNEIAGQQLEKLTDGTLNLVLGGGQTYYEADENMEELNNATSSGVAYTTTWKDAKKENLPLIGLFSEGNMDTTDKNMPKLSQMTGLALKRLSKDEDGFFLMIEGSQIDTYGHANNFEQEMKELYDFDQAIKVVMEFVEENPDTVVIITADHETGDLQIPAEISSENQEQAYYTTEEHTNKTVPVRASGYRTDELSGLNENTDIGIFVASLMGEDNFGHTSILHSVGDTLNGISDITNVKAVHVTAKNNGETVAAPRLRVYMESGIADSYCQVGYIDAGETMTLSYILPEECWNEDGENPITGLEFYYASGEKVTIEINDYKISERVSDK